MVNGHPDVAGVLRDAELLRFIGQAMAEPFRDAQVTAVLAPEARGPILGALVAVELGAGLVLARKDERNHPGADIPVTSAPTWRGHPEVFQGRSFDLTTRDRVVIVDDWITTGNTVRATCNILRVMGSAYLGASMLVNKADQETLDEVGAHCLVDFDEIVRTT